MISKESTFFCNLNSKIRQFRPNFIHKNLEIVIMQKFFQGPFCVCIGVMFQESSYSFQFVRVRKTHQPHADRGLYMVDIQVFTKMQKILDKLSEKVRNIEAQCVQKELTILCPKCPANPITVTPIWKWEFENKEHPIVVCI